MARCGFWAYWLAMSRRGRLARAISRRRTNSTTRANSSRRSSTTRSSARPASRARTFLQPRKRQLPARRARPGDAGLRTRAGAGSRAPEARANLDLLRRQNGARLWPESWLDRVFPGRRTGIYVVLATCARVAGHLLLRVHRHHVAPGKGRALARRGRRGASSPRMRAPAVWHLEQNRALAIIIAKEAEARLAPAESAGPAATLPAGSQVRVLSERGDWIYCELPGSGRGWISATVRSNASDPRRHDAPARRLLCSPARCRWPRPRIGAIDFTPPQPGEFPPPAPFEARYRFGWGAFTAAEGSFDFSRSATGQLQLKVSAKTIGVVRAHVADGREAHGACATPRRCGRSRSSRRRVTGTRR